MGELVYRLSAELDQFEQSIADADELLTKFAADAKKSGDSVEGEIKKVESTFERFAGVVRDGLASVGMGMGLEGMFSAYADEEKAMTKMANALRADGAEVKNTMKLHVEFAEQLARTTFASKDLTLSLLNQAEQLGLTGSTAQAVAKNAAVLKEAFGAGSKSAVEMANELNKGKVSKKLMELLPVLKDIKDKSERMAKAQKLIGDAMEDLNKKSDGAAGQIKKLGQVLDDLAVDFGKVVAEAFAPLAKFLKEVAQWFKDLSPSTKEALVAILAFTSAILGVGAAMKFVGPIGPLFSSMLGPIGIATLAIVSFADKVGGLGKAWEEAKAAAIKAWEWTEPIRKELVELFKAVYDVAVEIFTDIGSAIGDIWSSIAGESEVTWETVRNAVVGGIKAVKEFVVEHKEIIKGLISFGVAALAAYEAFSIIESGIKLVITGVKALFALIMANPIGALITILIGVLMYFVEWENALDTITVAFKNLGLTWKIVWTTIKLAFVMASDFIRNAFTGLIGGLVGGANAIGAAFMLAFDKIRGRRLTEGFRDTVKQAFQEGLDGAWSAMGGGESQLSKQLKEELATLKDQFATLVGDQKKAREERIRTVQTEIAAEQARYGNDRKHAEEKKKDLEAIAKVQQTLYNNAEALTRLEIYRDTIKAGKKKEEAAAAAVAATAAGGGGAATGAWGDLGSGALAGGLAGAKANSGPAMLPGLQVPVAQATLPQISTALNNALINQANLLGAAFNVSFTQALNGLPVIQFNGANAGAVP